MVSREPLDGFVRTHRFGAVGFGLCLFVLAGCDRSTTQASSGAHDTADAVRRDLGVHGSVDEPANKGAKPSGPQVRAGSHPVMAAVFDGENWMFLDTNGAKAVPGAWPLVRRFSSGLAAVNVGGTRSAMGNGVVGGHYEYIDPAGATVLAGPFENPGLFWHERLVTLVPGKKAVAYDTAGKEIASGYDDLRGFYGGLSYARKGDDTGFLNTDGSWAFELPAETKVGAFHEGYVSFSRDGTLWGFLDSSGAVAIEPEFEMAGQFWDGLAVVKQDGKYGFVDTKGRLAGEAEWDGALPCHEKRCAVKRGELWGFVDETGAVAVQPRLEDMRDFNGGKAAFLQDGKVGYIDPQGTVVIEPKWQAAYDFHFGRAVFSDGKAVGYIDDTGVEVIAATYVRAERFVDVTAFNEEHRSE